MSSGFTLMLRKNPTWNPDGPKDVRCIFASRFVITLRDTHPNSLLWLNQYARSVRKWNVKPTDQTTFYTHEAFLMRRISDPTPTDERRSCMSWFFSGKKTKKPVKVPAEDVQNGECLDHPCYSYVTRIYIAINFKTSNMLSR